MVALLMTMGFAFSATEGIDPWRSFWAKFWRTSPWTTMLDQPWEHHHSWKSCWTNLVKIYKIFFRHDEPQVDREEGSQGEDRHALHPHDPRQDHHHHLPHKVQNMSQNVRNSNRRTNRFQVHCGTSADERVPDQLPSSPHPLPSPRPPRLCHSHVSHCRWSDDHN